MKTTNYTISNEEEGKLFNRLLNSYWVDSNNSYSNSEEILKYYLRTENYSYIDTKNNNQIALYIAFSAKNEDLFGVLINSPRLKNKNYSLRDLNRFMASDEGMDNILFSILEQISLKGKGAFDLSDTKSKKLFIQSSSDYFAYNVENAFGNEQLSFDKLDKFIKLTKCKFYKNENQILHNMLMMDISNGFMHLYESTKNKSQKEMMLNFQRNPLNPTYNEETEYFLSRLKLNLHLSTTVKPKNLTKTKKNKI